MNKYIVINKTIIEERIIELKREYLEKVMDNHDQWRIIAGQILSLELVLDQSTSLIPIIENTFDMGKAVGIISYKPKSMTLDKKLYNERKQNYILNLKINI